MTRPLIATILLLLMMTPCACAAPPSARSRLLALEKTWMHAARTRDKAVLGRILGDDYIDINYKGIVRTRAQALEAPNVDTKRYTQRLSDEKVRIFGTAAVVTGRGVLQAAGGGIVAAWRFTDVFVERDGAWRAVASQETVERP